MSANPYESPTAQTAAAPAGVLPTEPLQRASGWMKFLGILGIIFSVLFIIFAVLSLVTGGAMIAAMMGGGAYGGAGLGVVSTVVSVVYVGLGGLSLWLSILLLGAGVNYSKPDAQSHYSASNKLRTIFMVYGILVIIYMVLVAIIVLLAIAGNA